MINHNTILYKKNAVKGKLKKYFFRMKNKVILS